MKAILEFDLDDTSDKMSHTRCVNSVGAYLCLWDLTQEIGRHEVINLVKELDNSTDDVEEKADSVISFFCGLVNKTMEDNNINLDDLE